MPRILRLHHAQITVPIGAEEQARAFYCGILGLPEIHKPDALKHRGGFWGRLGDQELHVGVESGVDRAATKVHLAYEVDDIAAWRSVLSRAGITVKLGTPISGHDRAEFRDPFGNRVELIQRVASA